MGLDRRHGRRPIRGLAGAAGAVVLVVAVAIVAIHRVSVGAPSGGFAARHAGAAVSGSSPRPASRASGLSLQRPFQLSSGKPTQGTRSPPPVSAGADMPPGSLPGYRLVYSQSFSGSALPTGWGAYSGQPGGDPNGQWKPANVVVSGGALRLLATPGSTGGVMFYGHPQTYGMYLVRMKGDSEPGLQISDIALLWPASSVWPPEIDFFEDAGGARDSYHATVHPGPDGDNSTQVATAVDSHATQWHTYGVEWTASSIIFTIDGHQAGAAVQDRGLPAWPDIPMNLALQSQNLGSAQPGHTIDAMTVDWVAEYVQS